MSSTWTPPRRVTPSVPFVFIQPGGLQGEAKKKRFVLKVRAAWMAGRTKRRSSSIEKCVNPSTSGVSSYE